VLTKAMPTPGVSVRGAGFGALLATQTEVSGVSGASDTAAGAAGEGEVAVSDTLIGNADAVHRVAASSGAATSVGSSTGPTPSAHLCPFEAAIAALA